MSSIRVYHVISRPKFETDCRRGAISCTTHNWPPYDADSVAFLFEDVREAINYAGSQRELDPVVIALLVDRSRVDEDLSSPRTARDAFLESFPELESLATHIADTSGWKSARVHRGPVPLSAEVELVSPFT